MFRAYFLQAQGDELWAHGGSCQGTVSRGCRVGLSAAEAADAEEDKLHSHDKRGVEIPDSVADKQRCAEKIRQAKAELEAEAKAAAEAELEARAAAEAKRKAEGQRKGGRKAAPPPPAPDAKAQKNLTDPQSRIMKNKDGSCRPTTPSTPKRRSSSRRT